MVQHNTELLTVHAPAFERRSGEFFDVAVRNPENYARTLDKHRRREQHVDFDSADNELDFSDPTNSYTEFEEREEVNAALARAYEQLTDVEKRIALALSRGKTQQQVADEMGVSRGTIAKSLSRIQSKMPSIGKAAELPRRRNKRN